MAIYVADEIHSSVYKSIIKYHKNKAKKIFRLGHSWVVAVEWNFEYLFVLFKWLPNAELVCACAFCILPAITKNLHTFQQREREKKSECIFWNPFCHRAVANCEVMPWWCWLGCAVDKQAQNDLWVFENYVNKIND